MHDSLNAVEDLMKVNQKVVDKQSVFDKYKQIYVDHFARNEVIEKEKQEIAGAIQQNGPAF